MDSEFDIEKNAANPVKHGVSLKFGARVFEDADHAILPWHRPVDSEDRYKAIGMVDGNSGRRCMCIAAIGSG